jgi:hypothetical protein
VQKNYYNFEKLSLFTCERSTFYTEFSWDQMSFLIQFNNFSQDGFEKKILFCFVPFPQNKTEFIFSPKQIPKIPSHPPLLYNGFAWNLIIKILLAIHHQRESIEALLNDHLH